MDCLDGMKLIPDKSIDMILCDLPYGVSRNKWDIIIPFEPLWEQYKRIIKDNGAIVLTAQTPFDKLLGMSNIKMLKYELIWEKSIAVGFLNAKKMPLKAHENILIFYKKLPTYNPQMVEGIPYISKHKENDTGEGYGYTKPYFSINNGTRLPRSVLKFKSVSKTIHPTQKPVALFEYLIKTYSNEGDVILDNCMGSGTTAIACELNNRKWIGFELEEKYVDIANSRIEKLKSSGEYSG